MDIKYWLGYLSEWLGVIAVGMIAGASPIFTKIRQVEFRFPQREATFTLSVFAIIYLLAFQYYSNPILGFLVKLAEGFSGGDLSSRMVLAGIGLILFVLAMFLRGQPFKSIGWGRANLKAGATLGFLLVLLTVFLRGKFLILLRGISPEQGNLLLVWLILSLAEETIFRGYIQLRLTTFLGSTWGWLATAGLFLLWQLPGRLWILPFSEILPFMILSTGQALLLGWIMRKSGHVLAPALFRAVAGWLLLI
ncbi:MAG: CPBP family intramembrane metalloprotease [Chloroflexi bacterium]|nr:CPBP family intramembrane metalloprotease [Chloroflexota bacterium]